METDPKRRQFLKITTAATAATFSGRSLFAESRFDSGPLYASVIPAEKNLDPQWLGSLIRRGGEADPALESEDPAALAHIGMTVGGIGCGTVYLSGDGQLYIWDIFHQKHEGVVPQKLPLPEGLKTLGGHKPVVRERDGTSYINPPTPAKFPNPFRQEFVLKLEGEAQQVRTMSQDGWDQVSFNGKWPLATIDYEATTCPLKAQLKAWTPFIPLDTENSAIPVTVMEYTVTNRSEKAVRGSFSAIWENPVLCLSRPEASEARASKALRGDGLNRILHQPKGENTAKVGDWGTAALASLDGATPNEATDGLDSDFELAPGESRTLRFLLTWHFPHIPRLTRRLRDQKPQYAKRFADADDVARFVSRHFDRFRGDTMSWVETWNDSTLPQWILDRTILTTNTLQTANCNILANEAHPNGRFWAWEGIGCCPGTCTHVWHYAQGVARLFPDLERNLREISDYDIGLDEDGAIRFRAESNKNAAIDGQAGVILRTLREHKMSPDSSFLTRVWPEAKRALDWLIDFDRDDRDGLDGLLDGKQHNTLDADWYGKVHCLCSMYLASLRAGEVMAEAMGDQAFARTCRSVFERGSRKISILFEKEFYIQEEDPDHLDKIGVGKGCYIDQVIGQWWAHQTGLGTIQNPRHVHSALNSLWRYNFVPHVGTFRKVFSRGRFYALDDDAGMIMCSWPRGGLRANFRSHWTYGYFNECMTGFEWQAAAHMIYEGAPIRSDSQDLDKRIAAHRNPAANTLRGLAISRAIHDRYAPSLRNPYNEIECSDHYARAGASYSVFLALCGYHHDGPNQSIRFAPKIDPQHFKAAFAAAEGWGSFEQKEDDGTWSASLSIAHGKLQLRKIELPWLGPDSTLKQGNTTIKTKFEESALVCQDPLVLEAGGPPLTILG